MATLLNAPNVLGRVIRDARRQQKLSQTALGSRAGLTQHTISRIERAPDHTTLDTLLKLLSALGLELLVARQSERDPSMPWES